MGVLVLTLRLSTILEDGKSMVFWDMHWCMLGVVVAFGGVWWRLVAFGGVWWRRNLGFWGFGVDLYALFSVIRYLDPSDA